MNLTAQLPNSINFTQSMIRQLTQNESVGNVLGPFESSKPPLEAKSTKTPKVIEREENSESEEEPVVRHVDSYCFDDLLISCSQEIIVNGMETDQVPSTIKDWVAGKITRALPKRLIQKLLAMILENRDLAETLAYRERQLGDVAEFALYIYRDSDARTRHAETRATEDDLTKDPKVAALLAPPRPTDANFKTTDIFVHENGLKKEGLDFFTEELTIEHAQVIPEIKSVDGVTEMVNKATVQAVKRTFAEISKDLPKREFREESHSFDNSAMNSDDEMYDNLPVLADDTMSGSDFEEMTAAEMVVKRKQMRKRKSSRRLPGENPKEEWEKIECHLCGVLYSTNKGLYKHQAAKHPEYWKNRPKMKKGPNNSLLFDRLRCHICDFASDTRIKMKQHQRDKHREWYNERLKELSKESNTFVSKYRKKAAEYEEIHYHKDTGLYECLVCRKTFSGTKSIVPHVEATHRDIKKAECHICGEKFLHKHSLKTHMMMHTGELPHECTECGRRFRQKHSLTTHMYTHTGNYPHNCQQCRSGFRSKQRLREHIQRNHPADGYTPPQHPQPLPPQSLPPLPKTEIRTLMEQDHT